MYYHNINLKHAYIVDLQLCLQLRKTNK